MPLISIVTPTFNEVHNIESLSLKIKEICDFNKINYEQIIKYRYNNIIEIHMKSYLDKIMINELENKIEDKKYIFTFNISNIYFSNNNNLLPLVKCNRCEIIS